ncbi:MAG: hypothetical protein JWQ36_924 [Enterovirga sp.]|jgi:hypothetical protein|nr:hypothetical protein [Enterovirga sp.]
MLRLPFQRAGQLACALIPLALGACNSTQTASGEGAGGTLKNFLLYGGATVPPAQVIPPLEVVDCPAVTVTEGGAAIRAGGTDSAAVRSQVSIANVARECVEGPDGAVLVKVGVQVRALLGPGAGAGGRYDTPVNIVLKRGEQVLATRSRRAAITIPAGQYEQSAVVVEEGMVVPRGTGEFDIEVWLGSGGRAAGPRRARPRT